MADPDRLASASMLAYLRERHPDVDVVVLPPEPEPRPRPVPVSGAALEAEVRAVRSCLADLLVVVAETLAPPPAPPAAPAARGVPAAPDARVPAPTYRWHAATNRGSVVPVGRLRVPVADVEAATSLGERVAQAATAEGWAGRWRNAGRTLVLDAEHEGRRLRVVVLDEALLVDLTGRELAVSDETLRGLVGSEAVVGE